MVAHVDRSASSVSHDLAAAQIERYLLERAPSRGRSPEATLRHRPAITISRMLGIPGEEIARAVGGELGFEVFDRQVLDVAGRDYPLAERIIEALDRGKRSSFDSWIEGWIAFDSRVIDPRSFNHMVRRAIRGISLHGAAVILGRGANFILRGTDAFRVRLVAPPELRVRAVMEASRPATAAARLSPAGARAEIERHAEERRSFMWRNFRADIDDPQAYDATFNLRRLDPAHAAGLILDAYRKAAGDGDA